MLIAIILALGVIAEAQAPSAPGEVVAAVRIQATPDAGRGDPQPGGTGRGMAVAPDTLTAVAARLRETHRFKKVEVRAVRSIADPAQVVIVVIIDEDRWRSTGAAAATRQNAWRRSSGVAGCT